MAASRAAENKHPHEIRITGTETEGGSWASYTVYVIEVRWDDEQFWTVKRRFSDFTLLRRAMNFLPNLPELPPKTWFHNLEADFVSDRARQLETFLVALREMPLVLHDARFAAFLHFERALVGVKFSSGIGIDDFDIMHVIGRGSYGKVVQARKRDSGEIYAVKILKKEELHRRKQVLHTLTERKILAQVDHPFIVSLRFAFQSQNKLYLVLDYFTGGELFFHLSQRKRFPEPFARFFAAEIVLALLHLHRLNFVYRDLKPENVLLDEQGHIKLTDFGLSSLSGNTLTHTFCGTPQYISPEIIQGKGYGKSVDFWSLGTLVFELLTGSPPFYHQNIRKLYDRILKDEVVYPAYLSHSAVDFLSKLLVRDPDKRLGSRVESASKRHTGGEVQRHVFFADIDWSALGRKEVAPPFVPVAQNEGKESLRNVHPDFAAVRAIDSPAIASCPINAQLNFPDFSYTGDENKAKLTPQFTPQFTPMSVRAWPHSLHGNALVGSVVGANQHPSSGSGPLTVGSVIPPPQLSQIPPSPLLLPSQDSIP